LFTTLFISTSIYAVELVNEQFTSNISGWSVSSSSKVYWVSDYSGSMFIDRRDWGRKTYHFGASYANQTLDVEVRWCATDAWESNNDYLRVLVNGSTVEEDYDGGGCQRTTFTADADSDGDFQIEFFPRTSSNNEDAYIDWFTLDGTPLDTGCDNSLDTSANDNYDGVAIPGLDNANSDTSACISGSSESDDEEYYHFTVNVDGTLDITTSSPNGHDNHFEVESSVQGTLHAYDTGQNRSLSYNLTAGEKIVILFKETGNDKDWWQANFNFTAAVVAQVPPHVNTIPNQSTAKDDPYTLDLSSYVDETNGDPISSYNLSGTLPTGLSFNSSTGVLSGTPSITGTFSLSLTADDNDGTSNSESFTLTILAQSPPIMNDIPNQTATNGSSFTLDLSTYVTLTNGDAILSYALAGTLPTGLSFDTATGIISGTPTVNGVYDFNATATDNDGESNSDSFTITVSNVMVCQDFDINTGSSSYIDIEDLPDQVTNIENHGDIITPMHNIDRNTSACIYGDSPPGDYDYYYFTVLADGNLNIIASSPNSHIYGLKITSDNGYSYGTERLENHNLTIGLRAGDTVYIRVHEDGSDTDEYQLNFYFTTGGRISGDRPFTIRNPEETRNLQGNYIVGGNMNLCEDDGSGHCRMDNSNSNSRDDIYIDIDGDTSTKNSTSFELKMPEGSKVVWAGLYWQGVVHRSIYDGDFMGGTVPDDAPLLGSSTNQIDLTNNTYGADMVKLQLPGDSNYTEIQADQLDYAKLGYSGFADVTDLVKELQEPNGVYMLADIKSHIGAEPNHGNYAGWALVVIYQNHTEDYRNITLFDGYATVDSGFKEDLVIDGFLTPKTAPINSKIAFFTMDGEGGTNSLTVVSEILNKETKVSGPDNPPDSLFNSTIQGVYNRQPDYPSLRLDLDILDLADVLGPLERKATLKPRTDGDRFTPSFFIMSSLLYVPTLCYDYTVQKDNFDITTTDRSISSVGLGDLSLNFAIQSEDGDFDLVHSSLGVKLVPTADTTFDKALYAPNNVNTLIPAIYTSGHSSLFPKIAIGEDVSTDGGRIRSLQRYFSEFNYHMDSDHYAGRFEVELNITVDYGPTAIPIIQSSENGQITRCEQSNVYNPTHGSFNIERHNSTGTPTEKYPLFTQVVGKDFDFDIVAYKENPAPAYSEELTLSGYTVDVELINAMTFRDNNATFICNNPNPKVIQTLDAAGDKHLFATFNNNSRVDMSSLNIQTETALRSAAFRVWYIVDKNNSIVPYDSNDPSDNTYFQSIYDTHLKADDTTLQASGTHGFCTVETLGTGGCSSYTNAELGTSGCYACMRDFFSKAVCSRDNFAIRPAAYRISIVDSNESTTPLSTLTLGSNTVSGTDAIARVSAGYQYKIEGNATSYLNDQTMAKGYTRTFDNTAIDDLSSLLQFEDQAACYDKNTTKWNISFINSILSGIVNNNDINLSAGNLVKHSNAGKYAYKLHDSNWTIVDQQRYPYKTFAGVDDCLNDDNSIATDSISKSGCDIDSKLIANTGLNSPVYNDLYLQYEPYKFDLSDINFSTKPPNQNHLFMTDLDDPYYNSAASLSNPMAASYEGNITALAKDDKVTTNFTDGCAASKLMIHLSREANASEATLKTQFGIEMQQYLQYGSDVDLQTTFDDTQLGEDSNLTLAKAAFEDSVTPGSARIRIYTTFKKPSKDQILDGSEGIDPIRVNYLDINATGQEANSSAEMGTHIPKGTQDNDHNVTFLYSKITPDDRLYTTEKASIATPLNIIVYCSYGPAVCRNLDLNTSIGVTHESADWYLVSNLFATVADLGTSDLNVSYYSGKTPGDAYLELNGTMPQAKQLTGVGYALDGTQDNILVSLPTTDPRPVTVEINYVSSPWLNYDPALEYYRVRFIPQPTAWTGHGKTGHVVGDDISTTKTKRLEW